MHKQQSKTKHENKKGNTQEINNNSKQKMKIKANETHKK